MLVSNVRTPTQSVLSRIGSYFENPFDAALIKNIRKTNTNKKTIII